MGILKFTVITTHEDVSVIRAFERIIERNALENNMPAKKPAVTIAATYQLGDTDTALLHINTNVDMEDGNQRGMFEVNIAIDVEQRLRGVCYVGHLIFTKEE